MQTKIPSWRSAFRANGQVFAAKQPGVPHLTLLLELEQFDTLSLEAKQFGDVELLGLELGFVDDHNNFRTRAEALTACGAAHAFTMRYPAMLRKLITWAERRPVRYFYMAACAASAGVAALIAVCEVLT